MLNHDLVWTKYAASIQLTKQDNLRVVSVAALCNRMRLNAKSDTILGVKEHNDVEIK
ncbi:hypothetical protein [Pseudoalteromonas xiamenensis]|uniref:Uncharacterized protein n=1 Tax=Pseudoalteromonas xiamenensis TaxID=882626 RepID=A0A975DJB5_9GAMM|nr:hypothetical protein [Pseudoalteromonas xiamenensis]QTH72187.1 hypothetical protein J5O05_04690 [Pseudoalteromonas xiamenensis]